MAKKMSCRVNVSTTFALVGGLKYAYFTHRRNVFSLIASILKLGKRIF